MVERGVVDPQSVQFEARKADLELALRTGTASPNTLVINIIFFTALLKRPACFYILAGFIETEKTTMLLIKGYTYTKNVSRNERIVYWICRSKNLPFRCPARPTTTENMLVHTNGIHRHPKPIIEKMSNGQYYVHSTISNKKKFKNSIIDVLF